MMGMSRSRQISNSLRVRSSIPLGRVDHHDGGIDGGQRAVGVPEKSSWPGVSSRLNMQPRLSKVMTEVTTGNPTLPLDAHPVGAGAAALALGAHVAGELDGAAGPQQMLGQGGFAGVGMGDDRERAAAAIFGGGSPPVWSVIGSSRVATRWEARARPGSVSYGMRERMQG